MEILGIFHWLKHRKALRTLQAEAEKRNLEEQQNSGPRFLWHVRRGFLRQRRGKTHRVQPTLVRHFSPLNPVPEDFNV